MSEKRFTNIWCSETGHIGVTDYGIDKEFTSDEFEDFLNEQEQKIQRWKNLYDIKDAEVTARVDALNKVCEYYLTEAQFKAETDPNEAVKEVINRILNTEVEW